MPAHAFWPFSDKVSDPSGPADIRGYLLRLMHRTNCGNGLMKDFSINNLRMIRWCVEFVPTDVYWHRVIAVFAAQRLIWKANCTVWSMEILVR
jgi:hypothetical protein